MVVELFMFPVGFTKVFFVTAGIVAIGGLGAMYIVRWCLGGDDHPISTGIMWITNLFILALSVSWIGTLYHLPADFHQPQAAHYKPHK